MNKQNSSLVRLLLDKIDHLDEATLVKKKVFNVTNLQMYTGWSLSKIYKLTSARLIPFSKPTNGSLFFEREKIEQWLLQNPSYTEDEIEGRVNDHLKKHQRNNS
ncbi:DNA-binding protein [Maribacter arcticus]|uniref:DNA-binding protein n=1 Tax=Maribacter arcticus TaxID=561365 RepID=UPI00117E64BE|nr:DNA-binding protein [Maribacter arcticus]|tara:strand:+ start:884 stop:1195 length:312 start_codon:yes stop_codon:yes gene_type:complete